MPPYLRPGLTAQDASNICMKECRAMCCRGPLILQLSKGETLAFQAQAADLGISLQVTQTSDGGGWVRFADHVGERCPMLDEATFACRIYKDRPNRCRSFPERPTPGCAISGGA